MASSPSPFAFSSMAGASAKHDNDDGASALPSYPDDATMEKMAAGAFRALCEHLRLRSDLVQNVDLMTVGGFCRNCLAKWVVLEAREMKDACLTDAGSAALSFVEMSTDAFVAETERRRLGEALDSYGYDEAAREVYGASYPEWKERHQTKATEDQLRLYGESAHLHATHDSDLLKATRPTGAAAVRPSEGALDRMMAGAFLRLCRHLRDRSEAVPNVDLMAVGGFCRNCLAKWLVVEARKASDLMGANDGTASSSPERRQLAIQALDSFGYDEAAQYVYGCTYPDWKERHQKKATDGQMERFRASDHLHAKHDKGLLATRASNDPAPPRRPSAPSDHIEKSTIRVEGTTQRNSLLSDVCCQDVDVAISPAAKVARSTDAPRPTPSPPKGDLRLSVGVLTVSDRAAAGAYASGDLSGPAVREALAASVARSNAARRDGTVAVSRLETLVVPDDVPAIRDALLRWSGGADEGGDDRDDAPCLDLVLTTGGTGFARRDVTPEATLSVLDRECGGLVAWAQGELVKGQPLAALSRAAAGTRGETLIVNLPGNPAGAAQVVEVLLPLLLHAIKDIRGDR